MDGGDRVGSDGHAVGEGPSNESFAHDALFSSLFDRQAGEEGPCGKVYIPEQSRLKS